MLTISGPERNHVTFTGSSTTSSLVSSCCHKPARSHGKSARRWTRSPPGRPGSVDGADGAGGGGNPSGGKRLESNERAAVTRGRATTGPEENAQLTRAVP